MRKLWENLYGKSYDSIFNELTRELDLASEIVAKMRVKKKKKWYQEAVVYALYVDLFAGNFPGLISKLPYLQQLGINCIWLLPVLDSPMKDAGFDVRDYKKIRPELLGETQQQEIFDAFIFEAHKLGISVIFDIAINHTSNQHFWFQEASKSVDNPYRNYYIWNNDTSLYSECRLLFEGMCSSNWEKLGNAYYFHRFFEFQPDLNYKNPEVMLEMAKVFAFWLTKGVDGFRADAIPYLWKEQGTDCENLSQTHTVVKLFRAIIDCISPGTLLLAEACQPPQEVVKYMGKGDECHAGYHFPLMPQLFKAIALQSREPVVDVLSNKITPDLPEGCQWFLFLRLHDELSLEKVYVNDDDRAFLYKHYCRKPEWDFRRGQGVSARLFDLMDNNRKKVLLLYSILFTLKGTPLIYYGDEIGKPNDYEYFEDRKKETGYVDSRNLVRGFFDWKKIQKQIEPYLCNENIIFNKIKEMLKVRKKLKNLGTATLEMLDLHENILAYIRSSGKTKVLVINNLSNCEVVFNSPFKISFEYDLLNNKVHIKGNQLTVFQYSSYWFLLE